MAREIVLHLTGLEAHALFGMAKAGEYEWTDTVEHALDLSPQRRAAELAAGERAMAKLRAA